ncbi:MAG: NAD-dependent protein deacylase [Promethearchaeota archaeon]
MDFDLEKKINKAAEVLRHAKYAIVCTGAGVSVESGIPPFRGPDGLWSKYDPHVLDLGNFYTHPEETWPVIKELFYDFFGQAHPNPAHYAIAELEKAGVVKLVVTQNIDHLHQDAGSKNVCEYHGTLKTLSCRECHSTYEYVPELLSTLPARCPKRDCEGILRPDFVFFGEGIPPEAARTASLAAEKTDVVLVVGTTGVVMPAALLPFQASDHGAAIIEVNTEPSNYTATITDIFLHGKAGSVLPRLAEQLVGN